MLNVCFSIFSPHFVILRLLLYRLFLKFKNRLMKTIIIIIVNYDMIKQNIIEDIMKFNVPETFNNYTLREIFQKLKLPKRLTPIKYV